MGRLRGRRHSRLTRRGGLPLIAIAAAATWTFLLPAVATAHPLGNFTINHYAGLTIGRTGVDVDAVIDMAEIPTFQERQTMDTDQDGSVSDDEAAAWAATECRTLTDDLHLAIGGTKLPLAITANQASFLPGAGGLSTLRLECGAHAAFGAPLTGGSTISFADASWSERIGWREIVATGDGTSLDTHGLPTTSPSRKLTAYPADLIAQPLDIRSASIAVTPIAGAGTAASADVVAGAGAPQADPAAAAPIPAGGVGAGASSPVGAVPGGVAGDLPDVLQAPAFTPLAILIAMIVAAGLGAWHALTPGHGKTLMAAYLVGTRGTPIHAVGLGLSVAVSHTLGIVVLALLVVGAQSVLAPDVVVRSTPVIAAVSVALIGAWMLVGEARRRRSVRRSTRAGMAHDHHDTHGPIEGEHEHEGRHEHEQAGPRHVRQHGHEHEPDAAATDPGAEHSHGGVRHTHLPEAGSTLSWRGLFVLGLAGGLIPSTSALLILLGSMAAGRPAFGLVLVIAFGLGMAAVMTGVGLAMVFARGRLDRIPSRSSLGRLASLAPVLASVAVLGLGVVLTWSAVAGRPVL